MLSPEREGQAQTTIFAEFRGTTAVRKNSVRKTFVSNVQKEESIMKEVRKIYFEMDGVLANVRRGVREMCGMKMPSPNEKLDPDYSRLLQQEIGKTDHFYSRLEFRLGSKELFDEVFEKYGDRCEILTVIPELYKDAAGAAEDKVEWVRRKLSPDIRVNIVKEEEKIRFCTGPETVLIDEREKMILEWEKKGGTGFLFSSASDTLIWLKRCGYLHYNYLKDDGPEYTVRWKRGKKATELALRLGAIEEEDLVD